MLFLLYDQSVYMLYAHENNRYSLVFLLESSVSLLILFSSWSIDVKILNYTWIFTPIFVAFIPDVYWSFLVCCRCVHDDDTFLLYQYIISQFVVYDIFCLKFYYDCYRGLSFGSYSSDVSFLKYVSCRDYIALSLFNPP